MNDPTSLTEDSSPKSWWEIQFRRKRSIGNTTAYAETKEQAIAQFDAHYPNCGIVLVKKLEQRQLAPKRKSRKHFANALVKIFAYSLNEREAS